VVPSPRWPYGLSPGCSASAARSAASSLGFTAYLDPLIPAWNAQAPVVEGINVSQGSVFAAVVVLGLTAVHSIGVHSSGRFQSGLAIIVVCAVWMLVIVGFASGSGSWSGLSARATAQGSWWAALLPVSYAYAGWNAAAYMGGEVRNPGRNLPRAIIGGCGFVMLLYLAVNALFFYAIPEAEWEPTIAVGHLAAERLFGQGGSIVISGIIALAMFGSVSAMTAVGPRIYYAMARDGLAPRPMARLSKQGRVPVTSIVAQGILASLLALTGAFEALLIYIGSSLLLFNALTIATLFVFRRRDGASAPFMTPLFPLPAVIFLGITLAAWGSGLLATPWPTVAALITLLRVQPLSRPVTRGPRCPGCSTTSCTRTCRIRAVVRCRRRTCPWPGRTWRRTRARSTLRRPARSRRATGTPWST